MGKSSWQLASGDAQLITHKTSF